MKAFRVTKNHVTKDINQYKKLADDNLTYDLVRRRYRASPTFNPVFSSKNASDYLDLLLVGLTGRGGSDLADACAVTADALPPAASASLDSLLPVITRAINEGGAVRVEYRSLNRERPIVKTAFPRALFHTGRTWAVRVFDCEHCAFRDFVLARMLFAEQTYEREWGDEWIDDDWETYVTVKVVPNPTLSSEQAEVVADEYGMMEGAGQRVWNARMRVALVPYFLDHHGLRPTETGSGMRLLAVGNWEQISQYDRSTAVGSI